MILEVDTSAATPAYEQIRAQITRMVVSGVLGEGARLPTIRQLAQDLGLAKGTVAKAYALLETHAVVRSEGPRGTFVQPVANEQVLDPAVELADAAESFVISARQLGVDLDAATAEFQAKWNKLP